jgi:hypothetical protein
LALARVVEELVPVVVVMGLALVPVPEQGLEVGMVD